MSDLFDKPTIVSIDGVAQTSSVQNLADATEDAFDKVENIIGDPGVKSVSLLAEIGDIQNISPELPLGVTFEDYAQIFNDPTKKEFILDLIVDFSNEPVITPGTWTREVSRGDLAQAGDYTIQGRSLVFYSPPPGQFTVTYTGSYPEFDGLPNGYMPNVYPGPALIVDEPTTRPTVTQVNPTRYRLEFTQINKNNNLDEFGAPLVLTFNSLIQTYVNNGIVPADYAAIWIKPNGDTVYRKLDTTAIYIDSPVEVEFETEEAIDEALDDIILVLANVSVADMLKATTEVILNHNHDSTSITTPVSHNNLRDLIPVSDLPNVFYGGSIIPGNDHPQYLNREGYKTDPGTYNNSMLGDLLMASINADSLFNNVLADSRKIAFGSISNGASIKFNFATTSLLLTGATNGLKINSAETGNGTAGKESFALDLNGHQIFNYKVAGVNRLSIGSLSQAIQFSNIAGTQLADIFCRNLTADGAIGLGANGSFLIDGIYIKATAKVGKRGILFEAAPSPPVGLTVDFDVPAQFNESQHDLINITNGNVSGSLNILDAGKIGFGDSADQVDNYLTYAVTENSEKSVIFNTEFPVKLGITGRRHGLAWGSGVINEYANLYTASPNGTVSSPSISDTYFELHKGALYLIKTTQQSITVGDTTYSWLSGPGTIVGDLQDWPRADLYAGKVHSNGLDAGQATADSKNGVSFGINNTIYVTGPGTNCPAGWMVFESQNGAVFVDSASDVIDCSALNYSDITAGNINSFGSIVASGDITSGKTIRTSGALISQTLEVIGESTLTGDTRVKGLLNLEKDLTSLAGATFNGNLTANGLVKFGNILETNSLKVNGSASFQDIATFESNVVINSDLTVENEVVIKGETSIRNTANIDNLVAGDASITNLIVTSEFVAKTSASIQGNLDLDGSITVSQTITADGGISTGGALSGDTLNILRTSIFGGTANFGDSITVGGDLFLNNSSKQLLVTGRSSFTGLGTFNGGILVSGLSKLDTVEGAVANFTSTVTTQTLNSSAISNSGQLNTGSLIVGSGTTFNGPVLITGDNAFNAVKGSFSGDLTVDGKLRANELEITSGVIAGNNSLSKFDDIEIGGTLTQTSATDSVTFSGPAFFTNTGIFNGMVDFTNQIRIGGTNKVLISDNLVEIGPISNRGQLKAGAILSTSITNTGLVTSTTIVATTGLTATNAQTNGLSITGLLNLNGIKATNAGAPLAATDLATKGYVDSIGAGAPLGVVFAWPGNVVPGGYLPCLGQPLSRTEYSDLFLIIGTIYGTGDGSTTFNIPDLRAMFIRGLDAGRGYDTGRTIGSTQDDMVGTHRHYVANSGSSNNEGAPPADAHLSQHNDNGGDHDYNFSYIAAEADVYASSGVIGTATETRPKNVAMQWIIKVN